MDNAAATTAATAARCATAATARDYQYLNFGHIVGHGPRAGRTGELKHNLALGNVATGEGRWTAFGQWVSLRLHADSCQHQRETRRGDQRKKAALA